MIVPNKFPIDEPTGQRLAIIGECPGNDETNWMVCPQRHGFSGLRREAGEWVNVKFCPLCGTDTFKPEPTPFVGPSGFLLNAVLREAGFNRRQAFVGNCAQTLVYGHELEDRYHAALTRGRMQLEDDLERFKPNCVLLLGNVALRSFHPNGWDKVKADGTLVGTEDNEDEDTEPNQPNLLEVAAVKLPKKKKATKPKFAVTISNWRGSIFESRFLSEVGRGPGLKCVSALHPAGVLRQPEWNALLRFDVARAVAEAMHPRLDLPERTFHVPQEICSA